MWIDLKKNTNTNKSDMQGIFFFFFKKDSGIQMTTVEP